MIIFTDNSKESTLSKKKKKVLELVSLVKLKDTRSVYKNQLYFYTLTINNWKLTLK